MQAAPLFVDRNASDYHLTPESPCIDAGDDSVVSPVWLDMDGLARIQGAHVDIGADEYECGIKAARIVDAKLTADGTQVRITGAVVSAAFDDFFYIESDDRACGIRVDKAGHGLLVGHRANIIGTLATNADGERCINATIVGVNGSGWVTPLGLPNKNIGLLVTIWGRITERDSASPANWFKIDDGSGIGVKCVVPSGVVLEPSWNFVGVTGISSCEIVGEELHRLIRIRTQDDIFPF